MRSALESTSDLNPTLSFPFISCFFSFNSPSPSFTRVCSGFPLCLLPAGVGFSAPLEWLIGSLCIHVRSTPICVWLKYFTYCYEICWYFYLSSSFPFVCSLAWIFHVLPLASTYSGRRLWYWYCLLNGYF